MKENITIRIIAVVFVIVSCWKLPRKLFPIWYGNFSPNIKFHIIVEYNLSNWFVARVYISNYSKAIVLTIIFNSKLYFLFKPCSSIFRKILFLVEYLEILCTFIMYVVHYAKQFCNIKGYNEIVDQNNNCPMHISDKNAQKRINKVSKVFIKFANAISNTLILCGQEN